MRAVSGGKHTRNLQMLQKIKNINQVKPSLRLTATRYKPLIIKRPNMKICKFLITLVGIITILYSCKKDSSENTSNSPNIIFSSKFENQNDLGAWTQSSGGQAVIDSSTVKFTNITECYHFETLNLLPVQKGKTYELKLTGKVNHSIAGDPAFCVGDFMIYVVQGSTNIISESFGNYSSWTQKSFSFEATSSASVKIKFLIGTTRGAWIDDLEFIEN